jgi:hypothetical protein
LELSYWAGPLDNQFRVSQAGVVTGLDVPPQARRHQFIAYGLTRLQQDTTADVDAGLDFRYALTPSLAAYATINPDFATVEADQERVNLSRFELQLPEKRPFFLEGAELYRQRVRTFYSRRIPDITGGAQVLGKQGPWTLAALGARSVPLGDSTVANYGVVRTQRDIGSSSAALMFANRTLEGVNQGSVGADATLFFTRTLGMTAQFVQSWGPGDGGTLGYFVRPAYDSPTMHFHVRYTHLGDQFADNVNAVGFIRDDDRRELDGALEHTWWFERGIFERTGYDSNYNIYWSQTGVLRSWQIDQSIEIDLRNRFSLEVDFTEEFKQFEKDFQNRRLGMELGYNTREFQSAAVGFQFGKNFDSDFRLWTVEAAYKLTSALSIQYDLEYLHLDPDPEDESTWIHVIRADQFFTNDLFIRLFFQTNSAIDRQNIQVVGDDPARVPAWDGRVRGALGAGKHVLPQSDRGVLERLVLEQRVPQHENTPLRNPEIPEGRLLRQWFGLAQAFPAERRGTGADHPETTWVGSEPVTVRSASPEPDRSHVEEVLSDDTHGGQHSRVLPEARGQCRCHGVHGVRLPRGLEVDGPLQAGCGDGDAQPIRTGPLDRNLGGYRLGNRS